MLPLMNSNGYYIPFTSPISAENLEGIDSENLTTLRFNKSWLPYVLGALSVLARPETYEGTKADIQFAAQQGMTLLGLWEDGNNCVDLVPNWRLGFISNSVYEVNTQIPIHSSEVKKTEYAFSVLQNDPENAPADIYIYGADSHGSAGGKIDILISVYPPGRIYTLDTWDCLGAHVSTSGVTTGGNLSLSYTNMKAVQLYFDNTQLIFGTAVITDDAVCSNA